MSVQKLERDGKVAVIYSPYFGAGWSTWHDSHKDVLMFDAEIALAVEVGDREKAARIAVEKVPDMYTGGARDLTIRWLEKGTAFRIGEYDGSESIEILGEVDWSVA